MKNGTAYLLAHFKLTNRNLTWFKQLTVQTSRKKESNSMFADIAYQKNQSSYIGVFRKNFIIWDDKK